MYLVSYKWNKEQKHLKEDDIKVEKNLLGSLVYKL